MESITDGAEERDSLSMTPGDEILTTRKEVKNPYKRTKKLKPPSGSPSSSSFNLGAPKEKCLMGELDPINHKLALQHLANGNGSYLVDSEVLKTMLEHPEALVIYDEKVLKEVDTLLKSRESVFNSVKPHPKDPIYTLKGIDYSWEILWLKRKRVISKSPENLLECLIAFNENWLYLLTKPQELARVKLHYKKTFIRSLIGCCFGYELDETLAIKMAKLAKNFVLWEKGLVSEHYMKIEDCRLAASLLVQNFNNQHGISELKSAQPHLFISRDGQKFNQGADITSSQKVNTNLPNIYSTLWFYSHQRVEIKDNSPYGSTEFIVLFFNWLIERLELGKPISDGLLLKFWSEFQGVPVFIYGFEKIPTNANKGAVISAQYNNSSKTIGGIQKVAEYIPENFSIDENTSTLTESPISSKCFTYLFYHRGYYDLLSYVKDNRGKFSTKPPHSSCNTEIRSQDMINYRELSKPCPISPKDDILSAIKLYRNSGKERNAMSSVKLESNEKKLKLESCYYCTSHEMWHKVIGCPSINGCRVSLKKLQEPFIPNCFDENSKFSHPNLSDLSKIISEESIDANVTKNTGSVSNQRFVSGKNWIKLRNLGKTELLRIFEHANSIESVTNENLGDEQSQLELKRLSKARKSKTIVDFGKEVFLVRMELDKFSENRKKSINARLQGLNQSSVTGYWRKIAYKSQSDLSWIRSSMTFVDLRKRSIIGVGDEFESNSPSAENGGDSECEVKSYHFVELKRSEPLVFTVYDTNGIGFEACKGIEIENLAMKSSFMDSIYHHYEKFLSSSSVKSFSLASEKNGVLNCESLTQEEIIDKFVNSVWNNCLLMETDIGSKIEGEINWNYLIRKSDNIKGSKGRKIVKSHMGRAKLIVENSTPLNLLGKEESHEDTTKIFATHKGILKYKKSIGDLVYSKPDEISLSSILGTIFPRGGFECIEHNDNKKKRFKLNLEDLLEDEAITNGNGMKLLDGMGRTSIIYANLDKICIKNVSKLIPHSQRSWRIGKQFKNFRDYWRNNETSWNVSGIKSSSKINQQPKKSRRDGSKSNDSEFLRNFNSRDVQEDWGLIGAAANGVLSFFETVTDDWDETSSHSKSNRGNTNVHYMNGGGGGNNVDREEEEESDEIYQLRGEYYLSMSVHLPTQSNALILWTEDGMFQDKRKEKISSDDIKLEEPQSGISFLTASLLGRDSGWKKEDLLEPDWDEIIEECCRKVKEEDGKLSWKSYWEESLSKMTSNLKPNQSQTNNGSDVVPKCRVLGGKVSGSSLPIVFNVPVRKIPFSEIDLYSGESGPNNPKLPQYEPCGKVYIVYTHDLLPHMIDNLIKPDIKRCWKNQQPKENGSANYESFKMEHLVTFPRNLDSIKTLCQHANDSIQNLYSFYAKFLNS